MKMKKFFTLILVATLLMPCLFIPAFADDSITDETADELLKNAFIISMVSNNGWDCFDFCKGIPDTTERYQIIRERIEALAGKTYVDTLAENAWEKCCIDASYNSILYYLNRGIDFSEMPATVKQLDFYAYLFMPFNAYRSVEEPHDYFSTALPEWLTWVSKTSDKASANIIVAYKPGEIVCPVRMTVEFLKDGNTWKISGGEFVNAMCDNSSLKFEYVSDVKYADAIIGEVIDRLIETNSFKETFGHNWDVAEELTYLSKRTVKKIYSIDVTMPDGKVIKGKYSAFFRIKDGKENDESYILLPETMVYIGYDLWVEFYGGGLYDLLVNGNPDAEQYHGESAPYTGDESVKEMIILTSVAITAACACLCVIRKREKIEE